jgi:DNA-binding beta-propeller fold protein YncE
MRVRPSVIAFTCVLVGAGVTIAAQRQVAPGRGSAAAPQFDVDRLWPKPLGKSWILGSITGLAVDAQDHIWIVHRGLDSLTSRTEAGLALTPPGAEICCMPAPPVLEFDQAGTLVSSWGGPGQGFDWPVSPGGMAIDDKGSVWITAAGPPELQPPSLASEDATARGGTGRGAGGGGAAGAGAAAGAGGAAGAGAGAAGATGAGGAAAGGGQGRRGGGAGGGAAPRPADAQILKFSKSGQFVLQIGKAGQAGDKTSQTSLNRPADVAVDSAANEVYVADGGNSQRIVVFDATTGAFKRQWGGHGTDFARLSCVTLSKDGQVYVCDRRNNRIQVFKKDGTFVKEGFVSKATLGNGAVWDMAFSNDAAQQFLFVADGQNQQVVVLKRDTLETLSSLGDGGKLPGQFIGVGSVAVDSRGTLFTGETFEGKRVQRFIKK